MSIEIRRVTPDEYEEAGRITALAYREFVPAEPDDASGAHGWDSYLRRLEDVASRDAVATVLVAVEDGRILGTLTLELEGRIDDHHGDLEAGEAHVRMLGVDPAARGKGIGRLLMGEALRLSVLAGKTEMTLNTTQPMAVAQRLYGSMGFTRLPDEVMPDGFVLLSYSLSLSETPAGTNSPEVSSTPSSYSASTNPPRNCS